MKEKPLSTMRIYFKTIGFNLPRIPFTIVGFVLGGGVTYLFARLDISGFWLLLSGFAGIFVYKQITVFGKYQYQCGQIAVITHALRRNYIPKKPFHTGMQLLKIHFEANSIFGLAGILGRATLNRLIRHQHFKDTLQQNGGKLTDFIKAVAIVMISGMLPFIGYCTMYWEFSHYDEKIGESVCNGAEAFFRNLGKMVPKILLICFLRLLQMLVTFSFFFLEVERYLQDGTVFVDLMYQWIVYNKVVRDTSGYATVYIVSIVLALALMLIVNLFIAPFDIISILRTFQKATDKKEPTGKLYAAVSRNKNYRFEKTEE